MKFDRDSLGAWRVCNTLGLHLLWITLLAVRAALVQAESAEIARAKTDEPPPLLFAYFVPSDREPIPGYVQRVDRAMQEVQRFYREGMSKCGYGPLTFSMDREPAGALRVHLVRGKNPMASYGRNSSGEIRAEVKAALAGSGVEIEARTLVIFEVLLDRQADKTVEVGPYVGTGDHLRGTAWVYDDERINPAQLGSKAPGGYYMHPCSIGEFNSHYIGGIAHELGHALGLPHVAGPKTNRMHSLMADGNHSYGRELRGEGAGSYLLPASAMLLSHCRPFVGDLPNTSVKPGVVFTRLQAQHANKSLILEGTIKASPAAFGIIAYNDSKAVAGDYDAQGWVAKVEDNGHFQIEVGELKPGDFKLRLQTCHINGATRTFPIDYAVDASGSTDTNIFTIPKPTRSAAARR